MKTTSLGFSSFLTVDDLRLALDQWKLRTTFIYDEDGNVLTGFKVIEQTLTDGSTITELVFIKEERL